MTQISLSYVCWCGDSFPEWDERVQHSWRCEVGRPYMVEKWIQKKNTRRSPRGSGGQKRQVQPR